MADSKRPDPDEEAPTVDSPRNPGAPRRIGRYTIRRMIASGGMGTVLEAIQDEPRRPVAIKIMKGGIGTPEALRRFQFEAQMLARLRHPAIAQIYEAGTHDDGSGPVPFFAMEYIPNAKAITVFAGSKSLSLNERLALFAQVCDAIHHGHQKGVVHRDIKPGNILVDSHGKPHVIDFGVARAADSDLTQPEHQTEVGQIIGSIAYMSPEQFDADPHDIDMRTDVYSLGVLLYELIVGDLPYGIAGAKLHEAARMVREDPPRRLRSAKPDVPVEVETIVGKALEKDRERRYQSAHGLAEDLRRFMTGQPIAAAPPGAAYQLKSFARRNKALLAGVGTLMAVLIAGVVVASSLYVRAEQQRAQAERERARAQSAIDFLTATLESIKPYDYTSEPTIGYLVKTMDERIEGAFPDDPLVEAELRHTIAWGFMQEHDWGAMQRHLERAIDLRRQSGEAAGEKMLKLQTDLGFVCSIGGDKESWVSAREEVVGQLEHLHGPRDPRTLSARASLADALCSSFRLSDALRVAEETHALRLESLGTEHEETLESEAQLAWLALARGELAAAEAQNTDLLDRCRRALGEAHDLTRDVRSQLAASLISQGKLKAAGEVYGGRPMLKDLAIETRYQGTPMRRSGTQLLVFWETWCPYSQRTVPRLEEVHQRFQELDVIGLTRTRPPSSDTAVMGFISDKHLSFPVAKVGRAPGNYYQMRGTPWIVIGHDGVMIWENSMNTPEGLLDSMLEGLASGAPLSG